MKKVLMLGEVVLVIGMLGGSVVYAVDTGDSFTITLTPTGDRGVIIDTTTVAFGSMSPGTTDTTGSIPVVSTGTLGNIEYKIKGSVAGGAALTADGDNTPVSTELCLQAQFNATSPTFGTDDVVTTSDQQVGDASSEFEGDEDMDNMGLDATKHLWCKVSLPSTIDYTGEQTITVIVTAEAAD